MKSVLDRYVISECLPAFGLSLCVFTFVLLMQRLFTLSDLVIDKGVPFWEILWLVGLSLPAVLPLLLPVSLLLAVLLAFGRLSADSEITAMRTCGVSLLQNLQPVVALSLASVAITAVVSLWVEPMATRALKEALYQTAKNRIAVAAQAGTFTQLSEGVTLYAGSFDRRKGALRDLFLSLDRPPAKNVWIVAGSGVIQADARTLFLDLQDGEIHEHSGANAPYRRLFFEHYRLAVPLPVFKEGNPDVEDLPMGQLLRRAHSRRRDDETLSARLEFHRRLALPLSCLVFGILGASLGCHHTRGGRSRSVTVCLFVLMVYYVLLTGGRALGDGGKLTPWLAMWAPNLILGAFSLLAFIRKNREAPLPLEEAIGRTLGRLRSLSKTL